MEDNEYEDSIDFSLEETSTIVFDPNNIIAIAPGENITPKSLIFDEDAEELSFPQIFYGQKRWFSNVKQPSTFLIANSEIRRYDRRGATNDHILYVWAKLQREKILSSINVMFRLKAGSLTASNALNSKNIEELITENLAYLKHIPNGPIYWQNQKKKVNAMIRQFGKPTFFLTMSAAEIHWKELINILHKSVYKNEERLSDTEFDNMSYIEKNRLIQNDPAICASYFEHKMRAVFHTFKYNNGPFGEHEVIHYYYRIEFQHRGSPHGGEIKIS